MSVSAPPPGAAPAGPPAPQSVPSGGVDAKKLHDLALGAEKNLEQLATALAHAGADPQATAAVGKMAEVMRKILSQMASPAAAPPPQQHTMGSATDAMMAAHAQAQQGQ